MTTTHTIGTVKYGDVEVPLLRRPWRIAERLPHRKTYTLKPGQHWPEADVTINQYESYVLLDDGMAVPVGAATARELMAEGALSAVFTELWGRLVLVNADLICVEESGLIKELLDALRAETGGQLGGLPDVIAVFPDGRIVMREAKNMATRDRLKSNQHEFARVAQRLFRDRLELAVVQWGQSAKALQYGQNRAVEGSRMSSSIVLDLTPFFELSDDQFYQLCQNHRDLKFERTAQGELVIVSPVGGEGGSWEADLIGDLVYWNRQTQSGKVFSSSTCFKLPNGANRSPDAAWVRLERWNQLTPQQQKQFPPLCPDFVIELRSESDALEPLQRKMQEYLDCGLRLGWLVNPQNFQVEVYRAHQAKQVLNNPNQLDGETVLPGFKLSLATLWG